MKPSSLCRFLSPAPVTAVLLMLAAWSTHSRAVRPLDHDLIPADTVMAAPVAADSAIVPAGRISSGITPVDVDRGKPAPPVLHYYDKHGNPLAEPVMFLATLDTVRNSGPASPYPLYNGVGIGVNFLDAILLVAGQKHASFDIQADVSLHNWFFPVVEAGLGFASDRPEDRNFRYKGKLSPYFKAGINYNFLYKSNPDYQLFLGLRAGFSHYGYDVTDITVTSGYWQQSTHYDLTGLSASSWYGEALAGIKVRLYKHLSMGWSFRYHFLFKTFTSSKIGEAGPDGMLLPGGEPWFIPGYGTNSPISFTFSLIWTIPRKAKPQPEDK